MHPNEHYRDYMREYMKGYRKRYPERIQMTNKLYRDSHPKQKPQLSPKYGGLPDNTQYDPFFQEVLDDFAEFDPIATTMLKLTGCRFITSGEREKKEFCNKERKNRSWYCPEHHKLCYYQKGIGSWGKGSG